MDNLDRDFLPNFWKWLVGIGYSKFQLARVIDKWLIFDFISGVSAAYFVSSLPSEVAKSIILPISAIFIGLTISWGANTQSLILTQEFEDIADLNENGIESYIFPFQLAIFVYLISVSLWGCASLTLFDSKEVISGFLPKIGVFMCVFFTCLAVRTSWNVVSLVGVMIYAVFKVRKIKKVNNKKT